MATQNDFVKIQVRIPPGVIQKLKDAAAASGRSMNSEIITRLEQSFEPSDALNDLSHEGRARLIQFARQLAAEYPEAKPK